ncbi:MAG: hypothetical protein E6Q24_15300 [Chitinophagaceae bacterium]|nr:MAG: hypothetical protein E6Q24_15300 [Chitinophagaceae bacterium]
MSLFIVNIISSHSIVLPALLLLRWRHMAPPYYPFAILLWLGTVNEFFSLAMILQGHHNMPNSNIYVLAEYLLLIGQFYKWNYWKLGLLIVLLLAGTITWIIDNILLHSLAANNSLFRMIYSAIIVVLSMIQVCKIITSGTYLRKNPQLFICLAFVFYYSFKTFFESFNLFDAGISNQFFYWLWLALNIVNLITNLIYAYAVLWIKKKTPFVLSY